MPTRRGFEPGPGAVQEARALVIDAARVGHDHPAVLVVSELATNAIRHAGTAFTVSVARHDVIEIAVTDRGGDLSPPLGRGLSIVEELSLRWGVERDGRGKRVWAEVPLS